MNAGARPHAAPATSTLTAEHRAVRPALPDEEDMLEWTAARAAENSRLSCQLIPYPEDAERSSASRQAGLR